MTDSSWQAPGSAPSPPPSAAATAAAPGAAARRRAASWVPPPRAGIVPLRPMSFGVVLAGAFRLLRRHPRTVLVPALVTSIATTGIAALLQWGLVSGLDAQLQSRYYEDFTTLSTVLSMLTIAAGFLPFALALAANALLGGPVGIVAARAVVAERLTWRGVRRRLAGRQRRLVGWAAVVLLTALGALGLVALPVLLIATTDGLGAFLAAAVGMLLLLAAALPVGLLATRLGFTPHAIAVDGMPLGAAIRRSWTLTRPRIWPLLGMQAAVWLMIAVAAGVLLAPVTFVLQLLTGLVLPNGGDEGAFEVYLAVSTIVTTAISAITGGVGLALQSGTTALLHVDTRMRVEGLDLALSRFVEDRARGAEAVDPLPLIGARA